MGVVASPLYVRCTDSLVVLRKVMHKAGGWSLCWFHAMPLRPGAARLGCLPCGTSADDLVPEQVLLQAQVPHTVCVRS